ncbi:MAG: hypothetical protein ACOY3P_06350 [Planctomycetota bacterium]
MRFMRAIGSFALVLWLAIPAAGRDIYVSSTAGDDLALGSHPAVMAERTGPVRTITRALEIARTGDRIILERSDEPYHECISLVGTRHSGAFGRFFEIQGNGAILDGSAAVPDDAWEHYRADVFRFQPLRMGYQQLFYEGKPLRQVRATGLAGEPPALEPLEWSLAGGWIYFRVGPVKLPADYKLRCARLQTGVTLFHVGDVVISDLVVQGFQLDGINAFNSAGPVHLNGVTCRGNGRSGVTVGGASLVDLNGSLAGSNGVAQLLTLAVSETHLRNSRLLGDVAPGWVDRGGRVYVGQKQIEGGLPELEPAAPTNNPPGTGRN